MPPKTLARRSRSAWFTVLAAVLVVIGAVLAPLAVVASWSKTELTDTDKFVAVYGPLADDPAIQAYITDQATTLIEQQVDIPGLTSEVIDGINQLGTGPKATQALEALKGPAAQGIQSLLQGAIARFVASEAFATAWRQALQISHDQMIAAVDAKPGAAVSLGADGTIGIQLAPVIAQVKAALMAQGIGFAAQIPEIDRTIPVAQSDALPLVRLGHGLVVQLGSWLPLISLLFLVAGVLVARRRSVALIAASVALAVMMALTITALGAGMLVAQALVDPSAVPSDVLRVLITAVTAAMHDTAVAVLVVALVVAVAGWFFGPFTRSRRLRGGLAALSARMRASLAASGLSLGRVGAFVHAQRRLLRIAVGVLAGAVIVFVRPLTVELIVWDLVVAVVLLVVIELVRVVPGEGAAATATATATATAPALAPAGPAATSSE